VASWAKGGGLDKIDAITTDISAIHDAGSNASMVRDACAELETSSTAAQFYRKIPQAEGQQHWAAALAAFKKAAGECLAAIDENQPALLKQTSSALDTGTTELAAATKDLGLS
jgi:chemotaxis regulatin CheY-phosphate phosphatase CheZ